MTTFKVDMWARVKTGSIPTERVHILPTRIVPAGKASTAVKKAMDSHKLPRDWSDIAINVSR